MPEKGAENAEASRSLSLPAMECAERGGQFRVAASGCFGVVARAIARSPWELTAGVQDSIANQEQVWYLTAANRLDMGKWVAAFQRLFREHSESRLERFAYREARPQLLMQAFLQ